MKQQKGQALILIALALVVMVGLVALAIDGGNAYLTRRSAQNAADAAAMAAAFQIAKGADSATVLKAANLMAETNGYGNGAKTVVTINMPPKKSKKYAGKENYVEVIISTKTDTYFGGLLGISQTANTVTAIAYGRPYKGGTLFNGSAIVALKPTDVAFTINGNATVELQGGGFWSNSNNSQKATILNGHITFKSDTPSYSVGAILRQGNITIDGKLNEKMGNPIALPPDLSMVPDLPSKPVCGGGAQGLSPNMKPGRYSGGSIPSGATFQSGTYCFTGSVSLQGNINNPNANVVFVLEDDNAGFSSNATATVNFGGLEVYIGNGDFHLDGSAGMNVNRLRIYSRGTSRMIVNGNAGLASANAFMYLQGGFIMWNGVAVVKLKAPPKGDPYAGLLLFSPWSNESSYHINGNSDTLLQGTFLTPHANATINGNAGFNAIRSQLVGYEVTINGNAPVSVVYDPNENVSDPQDAILELIQ